VAARPNDGPHTPDALVDDIEKTREQLAVTIDALVDRASPKNIAARQLERLKAQFVAPDGSPRLDQIGKVAGAVVGLVAVVVIIRRVAG
jgi:uncharacterized protein DUF3618